MSNWVIRNTAPASNNRYYVNTGYGGLNYCIVINSSTGECIPNCVGYAWGRFIEGVGQTYSNLSRGNAAVWYNNTGDGYTRSQNPKPGAVMCWSGGYYGGAGHVAIVEQVIDNNTVITSESDYGGVRWETKTRRRGSDGRWGLGTAFNFQGFILNPWVNGDSLPPEVDPGSGQDKPTSRFPLSYVLLLLYKRKK